MKLAFLSCAVIGIVIGLSVPMSQPEAGAVAPTPAVKPEMPVPTKLERSANGHFYAVVNVNDEPIRFMVDTGATTVALTEEDARRAHIAVDPARYQVVGRGAVGDVRGQQVTVAEMEMDGKRATEVRGVVMDGGEISLLGQSYLRHIDVVEIKGDTMRLH